MPKLSVYVHVRVSRAKASLLEHVIKYTEFSSYGLAQVREVLRITVRTTRSCLRNVYKRE